MNKFAERLTECMKAKEMSQTKLAELLNVKQQSVSRWVNGAREPDLDMLCKICHIFGEDPTYMLGYDEIKFTAEEKPNKVLLSGNKILRKFEEILDNMPEETKRQLIELGKNTTPEQLEKELREASVIALVKECRKVGFHIGQDTARQWLQQYILAASADEDNQGC